MANSKHEGFDKNEFIVGIKDMLDLFDDISFDNVNADADGLEMETNYYLNGNLWSSILIDNPSKALKYRIKAYGVKPRKLIGGWTN